jgi:hypothetical protein
MRDEELGIGLDLDLDIDGDADLDAGREGVNDEEARMVVDDEDGPKPNTDPDAGADAKPATKPILIPTKAQNGVNPPTSSSPLTPLSGEESDAGIERCVGIAKEVVGDATGVASSSSVESGGKGVKVEIKGKGKAKDENEDGRTRAMKREDEEEEKAKQKQKEAAKRKAIEAAKAKRQAKELEAYKQDVENALDLLEQLLHPISVRRMTPKEALAHPFLAEVDSGSSHSHTAQSHPSSSSVDLKGKSRAIDSFPPRPSVSATGAKNEVRMKNDGDYEPRKFSGGVCGDMHFVDPVTEQPGVIVRVKKCVCGCGGTDCCPGQGEEEVRKLISAGEGIAIGNQPCEFHREMSWS